MERGKRWGNSREKEDGPDKSFQIKKNINDVINVKLQTFSRP